MFFTDTAECLKHIIRKWETAVVSRFSRHIFAHRTMFRKCLQPIPLLLEIMRSPFCSPIPWGKRWREKHQHIKKLCVYKSRKTQHYSIIKNQKFSKWIPWNPKDSTKIPQVPHILLPLIPFKFIFINFNIYVSSFVMFLKIL